MFQFPGFASRPKSGSLVFNQGGYPIRKSADYSLYAATRSLSQLITSFFAFESLGIHHAPLTTSFQSLSHYPKMHLFSILQINMSMNVSQYQKHNTAMSVSPIRSVKSTFCELQVFQWRITDSNR